jgi:hypothetical protein
MLYAPDWSFIHIPRTGGVNFKHHALQLPFVMEYDAQPDGIETKIWMHNPPRFWYEDGKVNDLSPKWVTLVRNPYSRYLSLFFWLQRVSKKSKFKARGHGEWKTTGDQSFPDFVHADKMRRLWDYREVYDTPWKKYEEMGNMWKPYWAQMDWIDQWDCEHYRYDVTPFRLEDQLDKLKEFTGVDMTSTALNPSDRPDRWESYYTQELADVVHSRYEVDFRAFGYDKKSWEITN